MRVHFLRKNSQQSLIIFALGWGTDHSVLAHLTAQIPDYYDIVCIYDYKTIENIDYLTTPYKQTLLAAWSFGVWASEVMFSSQVTFLRAVAFCASPVPLSDELGIGAKRLEVTIRGFKKHGVESFNSMVYANEIELNISRETDEMIEELATLVTNATKHTDTHIKWDKAIIGEKDSIFPLKNMLTYWSSRSIILPLPHYPFGDYKLIAEHLGI